MVTKMMVTVVVRMSMAKMAKTMKAVTVVETIGKEVKWWIRLCLSLDRHMICVSRTIVITRVYVYFLDSRKY